MMTDIGYETRCRMLLNLQCAKCGVWVAAEGRRFVEFDGMPHSCAGEPYGKRRLARESAELVLELL